MTRSTMIFAAAAALAATAATVSFPAFAAPTQVKVRYADLNLNSAEGAASLKARVAHAAKAVCSDEGTQTMEQRMAAIDCTRVATARAMPQAELALANAGAQVAENSHVSVAAH